MVKKTQFQLENDQIMETILNGSFYSYFRKPIDEQKDEIFLELFITATCNQDCEYCYLVKHGDQLYPKELRKMSTILKNIEILLDYLYENKINPIRYDLFSGEIWGTKFGDKVFDIFIKYIEEGKITPRSVMIPSNCSFCYDEKLRNKMDWYIARFKKNGVRLVYSCSNDGLIIEKDSRPFKNKNLNEMKTSQENYDTMFTWFKKHDYAYHPMVSANNVNKWVENYDWWISMLEKYGLDIHRYIMTLEVRNDNWTNKSITDYMKFLDHMINVDFEKYYENDKSGFVNEIFGFRPYLGNTCLNYLPYMLCKGRDDFNCTIKRSLIVRMGDLAIGPCHRSCYPEFIYGKYDVEDGKIVGVTANNIQMMNRVYCLNSKASLFCDHCSIRYICMKGCLGAQFEANKEPLEPCMSVCEFFKAKFIFLYVKYIKTGMFEYAESENRYVDNNISKIKTIANNLLKEDNLLWNKWYTIAESIASDLK